MARILLASACLLAVLALAAAQPCIECKDCKTNNCYSLCKKSCAPAPVVVNGEACKGYGDKTGYQVSKEACETAVLYCKGGSQRSGLGRARGYFPVTLSQCQNIAYGVCQQRAANYYTAPCRYMWQGYQQCTKDQFWEFFRGEINALCNSYSAKIQ